MRRGTGLRMLRPFVKYVPPNPFLLNEICLKEKGDDVCERVFFCGLKGLGFNFLSVFPTSGFNC